MRIAMLCVFALLCVGANAQTATVSGTLKDSSGTAITTNAFLRFEIKGCGGNQPRVQGTNILVATTPYDIPVGASGALSGTIQRSDAITCGTSTTSTYWAVSVCRNGQCGPKVAYNITSATFNINSATPATTAPVVTAPTGDTTYLRLDGGNSPATGITLTLGPLLVNQGSASGAYGISATSAGNGSYGISAVSTGSGNTFGLSAQAHSASGTAVVGSAISSTGSTIGVLGVAQSASGIGVKAQNSNVSGKIFSGVGSAVEVFSVANTGAITTAHGIIINGATEITAQSGTGGTVLMSASPAITGNMTYANTTPVANLTGQILAYNISGTQQTNYHAVVGSCVLGTSCAGITLSGSAVFASAGSYFCYAIDVTAAAAVRIQYTSGSAFTLTGTGTDSLTFGCIGN